jgi:hypothetical protein
MEVSQENYVAGSKKFLAAREKFVHENRQLLEFFLRSLARKSLPPPRLPICAHEMLPSKCPVCEIWCESPFVISRRDVQLKFGLDISQYRETPLSSLEQITQKFAINENDHIFELGSGTGHDRFWVACSHGRRATGIDQIPQFVDPIGRLLDSHKSLKQKINFIQGNVLTEDPSQATIIYLDGRFGAWLVKGRLRPVINVPGKSDVLDRRQFHIQWRRECQS